MFTLIGSALGFFTSFLPEVLNFFKQKRDQAHELAVMNKQLAHAKALHGQKMQAIETEADVREMEAVYEQASAPSGVTWVDGLRGSVRPVITYVFMATFVVVEVALVVAAVGQGHGLLEAIPKVWDNQTQAIFATIISFWFGGRQFRKIMRGGESH